MSDRLHREFRQWRVLLGLLDIARLPALVDGRFGGPVQAQDREVASSWHRFQPVLLLARRRLGGQVGASKASVRPSSYQLSRRLSRNALSVTLLRCGSGCGLGRCGLCKPVFEAKLAEFG